MTKIQIKFACPKCEGWALSEIVVGGGSHIYNEVESMAKNPKDKDENKYFCWSCLVAVNPKLVDFALRDGKNA